MKGHLGSARTKVVTRTKVVRRGPRGGRPATIAATIAATEPATEPACTAAACDVASQGGLLPTLRTLGPAVAGVRG